MREISLLAALPMMLLLMLIERDHAFIAGTRLKTLNNRCSLLRMSSEDFRVSVTTLPKTLPLSPYSLAGKIERELLQNFGNENIERVVESWRLLERGYEHRQFIETSAKKPPESSYAYQHAPSFVPGLKCQSFWPVDDFSWAKKLRQNYKIILDEFKYVTNDIKRLQQEGNNIWAGALTKQADSYGDGWRTLVLMNRGTYDKTNTKLFPKTARAVRESGIPAVEVFFASMKPNSSIKMHSDFTNFVLTSHLALDIPENGKNKCRINVGDDCRQWLNGDIMMFDTSIMHDAINETESYRYILMFRIWHPDLTKVERDALQLIYDCLEFPDLLSEDKNVKLAAQKSIRDMRSFPEIQVETLGFGKKVKDKKK